MLAAWPPLVYTGAVRKAPGRPAKGPHGGFPRAPDSGRMRAPNWLRGRCGDGWLVSWRQDGRAAPTRMQTEKPPLGAFCFFGWALGPIFVCSGRLGPSKGMR